MLVVGGSLVGLSAALCLGRHGVPSFLVERHAGTAIHPRAAHFSQRTIEVFREAGVEDEVMEAAEREFVQNGAIMSVESLGGQELDWYFRNVNEGFEDLSPSKRLFITQIGLEPILRRRAAELGASLNYGWELTSLEVRDGENEAVVVERESGREHRLRARWVVAADGPRSPVRERLGIPMEGRGSFSNSITIYFRADVRPLLGDRNLSVVYVFHPRLVGFFRFSKAGDAGFLVVNRLVGEDGVRTTDVSALADEERCIEWVRLALGAPDLLVEIENVQNWVALADSAAEYRRGNVLIAGDAAHTMPPTGGFGGNTGVQDAHNLAWKLAAVLDGTAGESLLDTYDSERRPVGKAITEQAYTRYVLRLDPELGTDDVEPMIHDAPIELGYRYGSEIPPATRGRARRTSGSRTGVPRSTCSATDSCCSRRAAMDGGALRVTSRSTCTRSTRTASPAATASAPMVRASCARTGSSRGVQSLRRRIRVRSSRPRYVARSPARASWSGSTNTLRVDETLPLRPGTSRKRSCWSEPESRCPFRAATTVRIPSGRTPSTST